MALMWDGLCRKVARKGVALGTSGALCTSGSCMCGEVSHLPPCLESGHHDHNHLESFQVRRPGIPVSASLLVFTAQGGWGWGGRRECSSWNHISCRSDPSGRHLGKGLPGFCSAWASDQMHRIMSGGEGLCLLLSFSNGLSHT